MRQKLITVAVARVLVFFAFPLIAGISSAASAAIGGMLILGLLGAVQFPLLWYATTRSKLQITKDNEQPSRES